MSTVQMLNAQFGIDGHLSFNEDASGLIIAMIENSSAKAALCLQGGHLMTWQPVDQSVPVVWLSRDAKVAAGKSIRGGAPVCWPWFGAHASESSFPGHGFARTVPWRLLETGVEPGGATRLRLRLENSETTLAQWPHACQLDLNIYVGETLRMELVTENTGSEAFVIGEALHTYFQIGDIGAVRVSGLEGCEYWDKVGGSNLRRQTGSIAFAEETDRVYISTAAECVIEDKRLKRRIHVSKSGSQSTVVWTPWVEKAEKMGDMGQPDGWREMVCVESANALENLVTVAPGTCHSLVVEYRAVNIA